MAIRARAGSADGAAAQACAFLELVSALGDTGKGGERFGVGMDTNIVTASIQALISGVNRLGLVQPTLQQARAA